MKENLIMMIPQLMQMTKIAGAMLVYTIAISHPKVEEPKKRNTIVIPVNVPNIV